MFSYKEHIRYRAREVERKLGVPGGKEGYKNPPPPIHPKKMYMDLYELTIYRRILGNEGCSCPILYTCCSPRSYYIKWVEKTSLAYSILLTQNYQWKKKYPTWRSNYSQERSYCQIKKETNKYIVFVYIYNHREFYFATGFLKYDLKIKVLNLYILTEFSRKKP